MRTTKTTITCDRCGSTYSPEHWSEAHRKQKDSRNFDPEAILGGDFCAPCTVSFDSLFLEAYHKWQSKDP